MDTEEEVEAQGLSSRAISRRTLIKGGAIVGGTVVAPAVESFASKAFAASVQHACCQCYDPNGTFIGAAQDDYTDAGCRAVCSFANPNVSAGTFLRFTAATAFTSEGVGESQPGCSFNGSYLVGLPGESSSTCPSSGLPSGVSCDEGTWP